MKKGLTSITSYIVIFVLMAMTSQGAIAADDVSDWAEWGKKMLQALFSFIIILCIFAGVVFVIVGITSYILLQIDKAPQVLQNVGMKACFALWFGGSSLIVIGWIVSTVTKTFTGQDIQQDTFKELQGHYAVPAPENYYVSAISKNVRYYIEEVA